MDWQLFLLIFFGGFMVLMLTGLPIAFVFLLINLLAAAFLWGGQSGLNQLVLNMRLSVSSFAKLPIPMFILLGEVMFQSGMGMRLIDVLEKWLGRLPGRLGLIAVAAATLLSTMTGLTVATVAMLGAELSPEMEKRGYKKPISLGAIMGTGGLAMIIPPSSTAVLLASIGEFSVGRALMAGVVPGLMIAALYAIYIVGRCWLQPSIAPAYEIARVPLSKKLTDTVKYVLPLGIIIVFVLGFIFFGIATPTESAAMGALGSIFLAAGYKKLNWDMIKKSVLGTVRIAGMIFMVILTATTFTQLLSYTGATRGLIAFVQGLPLAPLVSIIAMQVVILFLGMFMGLTAIVMITVPTFIPIVIALGFDPVWFGLLTLIGLEMGQTTPPVGSVLFVMKGVAPPDTTFPDIWRAGIPFLLCDLTAMSLVIAFPALALWLPSIMIR